MTKICPNCKTENSDIAGFCQKCGSEIQDPVKAPRVQETTNNGGLGAWWRRLSNSGKGTVFWGSMLYRYNSYYSC